MRFASVWGMRYASLCSLLLALALGCGDDDGLTVQGQVAVDADGTPTGFQFLEETRLVDLGRGELPGSVMAGECRVVESPDGEPTVFVALQAPGSPPEGVGLHRFEVLFPSAGGAEVLAQLGSDDYTAAASGTCAAELTYAEEDEVGATIDCALAGPGGASATVQAELDFDECVVR